jgi:hypothetical protein
MTKKFLFPAAISILIVASGAFGQDRIIAPSGDYTHNTFYIFDFYCATGLLFNT